MTIHKSVINQFMKTLDPGSPIFFAPFLPSTRAASPFFIMLLVIAGAIQVQAQAAPARDAIPEEIIINAPQSLRLLRVEIDRAQENLFNVFNELNDDDKYDVHCDYVTRWHSKIRQQVCRPAFANTALEQEARTMLGERGHAGVAQIDHYNGFFEEKLESVFQEHPEFRQAINEYNSLVETLDEIRSERFGLDD